MEKELAHVAKQRDELQTSLETTNAVLVSQQVDQSELQQTKEALASAMSRNEQLGTEIESKELALRLVPLCSCWRQQERFCFRVVPRIRTEPAGQLTSAVSVSSKRAR